MTNMYNELSKTNFQTVHNTCILYIKYSSINNCWYLMDMYNWYKLTIKVEVKHQMKNLLVN